MARNSQMDWTLFQPSPVVGVDEVGRGCLAGDVFSAAVILNTNDDYPDSKTVSPEKRNVLYQQITSTSQYGIGWASVEEIDQMNILQATFLSMRRAISHLSISEGHILVDGHLSIPQLPQSFQQTTCIKGDQRFAPIAAASILAKVTRDRWMCQKDKDFPQYGFSSHKGYGTLQHKQAIIKHGPCSIHRKHFAGVKEYI